jgi:hypothetical protein
MRRITFSLIVGIATVRTQDLRSVQCLLCSGPKLSIVLIIHHQHVSPYTIFRSTHPLCQRSVRQSARDQLAYRCLCSTLSASIGE